MSEEYMVCKNIDEFFDNVDVNCNLLNVEVGGKFRSFCRCGAVHTKRLYECPSCGKTGGYWASTSRYSREIFNKSELVSTPDGFNINLKGYGIELNSTTNELEFNEISNVLIGEKTNSGLDFFTNDLWTIRRYLDSIKRVDFLEIKKNDLTFFSDWEDFDFEIFYSVQTRFDRSIISSSSNYCLFAFLKKNVPWMFVKKDEFNPALIASHINNLAGLNSYSSLSKYIKAFDLQRFKPFIKCPWFYSYNAYSQKPFSKEGSVRFNKLSDEYQDLLIYYIEHYKLNYNQVMHLSEMMYESIRNHLIDEVADEVFIKYLKDNLISSKEKTVEAYLDDLNWLGKLKLGKTHENIRNINFLRNAELLREAGYPDKKIGVFMDSFYDNPLKASYYLKSKKDLTKKEINEFIESQTK